MPYTWVQQIRKYPILGSKVGRLILGSVYALVIAANIYQSEVAQSSCEGSPSAKLNNMSNVEASVFETLIKTKFIHVVRIKA